MSSSVSGAQPERWSILPVVSMSAPRNCRSYWRGHKSSPIRAKDAFAEVTEGNGIEVRALTTDTITLHGLVVTRFTFDLPGEGRIAVVSHDASVAQAVAALSVGVADPVPWVWAPSNHVLFGLVAAQRSAINGGGISLARQPDYDGCILPAAQ